MAYIALGVHNHAVGLRHAGWLTLHIREGNPELRVELRPISTAHDRERTGQAVLPGRSFGVAELWAALRAGAVDAVWLDMRESGWPLPDDIELVSCFPRRNPREALLHNRGTSFAKLPPGTRLSTINMVTKTQIAAARPDIAWVPLSGDLPARLHKVHLQHVDGVVESASDLLILGFDDRAIQYLSTDDVLSCPGQGVWGVCSLRDRADIHRMFEKFDDAKARMCMTAEWSFIAEMGLPDTVPAGVWARAQTKKLMLDACVAAPGRKGPVRLSISGPPSRNEELVTALVEMFRHQGVRRPAKTRR